MERSEFLDSVAWKFGDLIALLVATPTDKLSYYDVVDEWIYIVKRRGDKGTIIRKQAQTDSIVGDIWLVEQWDFLYDDDSVEVKKHFYTTSR